MSKLWMLVPIFLAQAFVVRWAAGSERLPAPPDLAKFPVEFGGQKSTWKQVSEDAIAAEVMAQLGADRVLSRTYASADGSIGGTANLFVAWFQSQRGGTSQPHSPKVCLPGSGWIPESTGELTLETGRGPITVNRYVIVRNTARAVVLYWYQTSHRVTAGEWASKFWVVADSLTEKRTDTALIRVVVYSSAGNDAMAAATASQFAADVYPPLRERLYPQF